MKRQLILPAIALALLFTAATVAQLQQSGGPGSTVNIGTSLPAGSAVIGKLSIDQTTPGTTNAVQVIGSLPAGSAAIGSITNSSFAVSGSLPGGTNTIGYVRTAPLTSCGTTIYDSGPTLLPTSATAVTGTSTCVQSVYLTNLDSSAHTVTVSDGSTACSSGVCTYVGPAFSIPALSNMRLPLDGMKLTSGVKWQVTDASTNKVIGEVFGYQ